MTKSSDKLLPCPFCGGPASVRPYGRRNWVASCKSDPEKATCPAVIDVGGDSRAEAIAAWNTRASRRADNLNPEALGELYEALKEARLHVAADVEQAEDPDSREHDFLQLFASRLAKTDAALRKARGEQS